MRRHHEKPLRRVNPSGRVVWVARWTDEDGHRSSAGTFDRQGPCREERKDGQCCAQHAIWAAYTGQGAAPKGGGDTVGGYAGSWLDKWPRADRTEVSYRYRLSCVLDVRLDGRPFRDWRMADVRQRQVNDLVAELLVVQKRARTGALGILWVLAAMWKDARRDEVVEGNPFREVTIRANDRRIATPARRVRVFSWADMHRFAAAAAEARTGKRGPGELDRWRATYAEAMVRTLSDCGLRLGELLALRYRGWVNPEGVLRVERTAWHGRIEEGTKTDHGEDRPGRSVPVPPGLLALLEALPRPLDPEALLFPAVRGGVWQESLFYRDVWRPAQEATGMDMRPHEARHSYVSLLRAARIDPADLAVASGHTLETATKHYTHALNKSADAIRGAVG